MKGHIVHVVHDTKQTVTIANKGPEQDQDKVVFIQAQLRITA
jgi:hypothetical protein